MGSGSQLAVVVEKDEKDDKVPEAGKEGGAATAARPAARTRPPWAVDAPSRVKDGATPTSVAGRTVSSPHEQAHARLHTDIAAATLRSVSAAAGGEAASAAAAVRQASPGAGFEPLEVLGSSPSAPIFTATLATPGLVSRFPGDAAEGNVCKGGADPHKTSGTKMMRWIKRKLR